MYKKAFTAAAWRNGGSGNNSFTTMCRMLKEMELFMTVRRAIR